MHERPTERARALLDGLTAHAIVERVHPYYQGYQFEGEWLDALKDAIADELDEVDAKVPGTCDVTDNGPWGYPYVCSACGASFDPDVNNGEFNYCPNCGRLVERGDRS